MQKVFIVLLCIMIVLALPVSMGMFQDRGFFANIDQVSEFARPIMNAIEVSFKTFYVKNVSILKRDTMCIVERLHFTVDDSQYYCDFAWTSSSHAESGRDPLLVDHNYGNGLVLKKYSSRIVLNDDDGNEVYNKSLLFTMRKRESISLTYGEYLDYVKGIPGSLKNISLS